MGNVGGTFARAAPFGYLDQKQCVRSGGSAWTEIRMRPRSPRRGPAAPHFFISRAGPDAAYAVKIAHILERAGYRVFIQDRDIINESIIAAMHGGLIDAPRTIALLSADYLDPKRVHCAAEWQATIAQDPLNQERKLILLRVAECAPPGLLKSLAYWDLVRVRGDDQLLADIVLHAVDPSAGKALPEAVADYWREARPIVHSDIRETPSFTGRGEAMADIDAAITQGATVAITQSPVAIHGMGGIGKSTLARQYAYEASKYDVFSGIWWLGASRDPSTKSYDGIESGLLDLRATLYPGLEPPKERAAAARGMLELIANGGFLRPWLLIYDNIDDMAALRAWAPPANAHVLVTTRLTTFREGEVMPIAIEEWALPDAVRYLLRESGRREISPAQAEAIAEALGRLPLALSHAAAYLREVPTATPASYLAAIERRMKSVPPGMQDAKSVYVTFQEAIAQADALGSGSGAVMAFAALLAPDNIPWELFRQEAGLYPPALAAVLADPDAFEAATGALARLSLIDLDREANTFSVHRLVQDAARDGMAEEERGEGLLAAVALLNAGHPGDEFQHWGAYERLLPHVRLVADVVPDEAGGTSLALMLSRAGFYLYAQGKYDLAEPLYKRSLSIRETALGPDHPSVGTSLNNLAGLYRAQGKYDLAEPLYKRSLSISETALGPDHPSVGTSLNNLAGLYRAQGKYDLAEPLYKRDLAISETALGPDHPDVGTSLNNLAGLYESQGKYDLAEPLYKRSLSIRETALGPDHPDVGTSLFANIAILSHERTGSMKRWVWRSGLRGVRGALGAEHPHAKSVRKRLPPSRPRLPSAGREVVRDRVPVARGWVPDRSRAMPSIVRENGGWMFADVAWRTPSGMTEGRVCGSMFGVFAVLALESEPVDQRL